MPTAMSSGPDSLGRPEAAHQLLGRRLRILRELSGVTRSEASRFICASDPKISRLELGDSRVKAADLQRLLDLYRVTDAEERTALAQLADRLNERQWWHDYKDVLAGWFCSYLVFESIAQQIRAYEVRFLPGLLQTRAYAEAVIRLRHGDEGEVRRRVDVRMRRQQVALKAGAPKLWAIIDEAALTRHIAGATIMREQIEFLIQTTRRGQATIQVLPADRSPRAAAASGTSFSTLRINIKNLSDIVYLEQVDSAMFLDSPSEIEPFEYTWPELAIAAKPPNETLALLQQARQTMR